MINMATDFPHHTSVASAKKTRAIPGKTSGTASRTGAQEAKRLKRALRELSDTVLLFLHWMDSEIGPDKSIPRDLSAKLGKVCTSLDMKNDMARRFALDLPITAAAKKNAVRKLCGP